MSFPKYSEYKESGHGWIRDMPEHWIEMRAKVLFGERKEKADAADQQLTASQKYGVIPQAQFSKLEGQKVMQVITGREILKKARPNDFVISMRSFQGGLEFCEYEGAISSAYVPIFSRYRMVLGFFKHLFKSETFIKALQLTSNLVRDGQALRFANLCMLFLPYPSLEEQKKIAVFLDHETARIDVLIAEQQRLIELLKEKRQAVISHAVTKGLNPNAPIKDSGVEWLGEVPAHWKVLKLKHVVREIVDAEHKTVHFVDDGRFLVARTSNVREGRLVFKNAKYTDEDGYVEWTERGVPAPGDIIFTREAPAGEACIVPKDVPVCLGQRTVLLRLKRKLVSEEYCLYSIYSGAASRFIENLSQGSTVSHINMADIPNMPIFLPPFDEQLAIAQAVKIEADSYEELLRTAVHGIELLLERRSALISAAVTGKIDVRGWQPNKSTSPEPVLQAAEEAASYG